MLYLDSSSCLKLLWPEAESAAVAASLADETEVCISRLAELEVATQLRAAWLGGEYSRARYRAYQERFQGLREQAPFRFRELPGSTFGIACERVDQAGRIHLRTLDRLHLAAMEELGARRLMTHDLRLARAARAGGLAVLSPR